MYLRLAPGQAWDEVPQALVEDCAQLTKANSIEGTTISRAARERYITKESLSQRTWRFGGKAKSSEFEGAGTRILGAAAIESVWSSL